MCFFGGGSSSANSGPAMSFYNRYDQNGNVIGTYQAEAGIPQDYINKGATTVAQYQQMAAQDLSDKQIQAQKDIADQQAALNQKQFEAQQTQVQQQQTQTDEQAQRQSTYDTGRAQALQDAQSQISDAFSKFSPDYFKQYVADYMTRATDPIDYQQKQAQKALAFATARQGISGSQADVNQQGLIQEARGRALDEQAASAQQAAAQQQNTVAAARANLLNQVAGAQAVAPPIAGSTIDDVNQALQTQRSAVTGISNNAGDVVASLQAVPTVNTLGNIFSGVLGAGGAFLGGAQSNQILQNVNAGLAGTNPSGTSTRIA